MPNSDFDKINSDVYSVNEEGIMEIDGHDVRDLLSTYGSPLIVLREDLIRANCRGYLRQIHQYPRSRVYYASKAFLTTGFCRILDQEDFCLDVVSAGELYTAIQAGFPPERILMHGNAKTEEDLRLALNYGIGRVVIDNVDEIDRLAHLAAEIDRTQKVYIRVTPGVKPSTHEYIQTGQTDSKFGFNLLGGAAEAACRQILQRPSLELVGLHCHIGSQILALKPYAIAAKTMMRFYAFVQQELGAPLDELNMGGGLGIRYLPDDYPPDVEEHVTSLAKVVLDSANELGVEPPILCDEPGRSIVGRPGITLYTVQSTKRIPDVRNYVSVDGGMTDNPRFALYQSKHQVVVANKMRAGHTTVWTVSGRCCESGDVLQRDVTLCDVAPGDIIALLSTGAYTYSMASHYNRLAKPAVLLVGEGRIGLLAERESLEDLIRMDRLPEWLERNGQEEDA